MSGFDAPDRKPTQGISPEINVGPLGGDARSFHNLHRVTAGMERPDMSIFSLFDPPADKKCDELYEQIADEHGLGLCQGGDSNIADSHLDMTGMGPASLWVLGSKIISKAGLSLIKGALSANKSSSGAAPKAGKPRTKSSDKLSKTEDEIMTLATSGSCPQLLQKWFSGAPALTHSHRVGNYIVIEQRLASYPRKFMISVFSRDGTKMLEEDVVITVQRNVWKLPTNRNANLAEITEFVKSLGP